MIPHRDPCRGQHVAYRSGRVSFRQPQPPRALRLAGMDKGGLWEAALERGGRTFLYPCVLNPLWVGARRLFACAVVIHVQYLYCTCNIVPYLLIVLIQHHGGRRYQTWLFR